MGFYDIIGEHDRLHPIVLDHLLEHIQRMQRHTDVTDLAGSLCLQRSLHGAAGGQDLLQLRHVGIMELIQVDVVRTEVFQAGLNILRETRLVPGHGFGGQDKVLPDALQGVAKVFLRNGVATGRVYVVDAHVLHFMHQYTGTFRIDALDGDTTKAQMRNLQAGFSKCIIFYNVYPLSLIFSSLVILITSSFSYFLPL